MPGKKSALDLIPEPDWYQSFLNMYPKPVVHARFFFRKKHGNRTSMVCPKAETSPTLEERISKFKNMSA
jgi:hypothetical protein